MTEKTEIKKPSLYIAMPCYDSVKIQTMVSMCKLVAYLTRADIKVDINTLKSPYISYARNILTAQFMKSDKDYLLFPKWVVAGKSLLYHSGLILTKFQAQ